MLERRNRVRRTSGSGKKRYPGPLRLFLSVSSEYGETFFAGPQFSFEPRYEAAAIEWVTPRGSARRNSVHSSGTTVVAATTNEKRQTKND